MTATIHPLFPHQPQDPMSHQHDIVTSLHYTLEALRSRKAALQNEIIYIDGDIARAKEQLYEEMQRLDGMMWGK